MEVRIIRGGDGKVGLSDNILEHVNRVMEKEQVGWEMVRPRRQGGERAERRWVGLQPSRNSPRGGRNGGDGCTHPEVLLVPSSFATL